MTEMTEMNEGELSDRITAHQLTGMTMSLKWCMSSVIRSSRETQDQLSIIIPSTW